MSIAPLRNTSVQVPSLNEQETPNIEVKHEIQEVPKDMDLLRLSEFAESRKSENNMEAVVRKIDLDEKLPIEKKTAPQAETSESQKGSSKVYGQSSSAIQQKMRSFGTKRMDVSIDELERKHLQGRVQINEDGVTWKNLAQQSGVSEQRLKSANPALRQHPDGASFPIGKELRIPKMTPAELEGKGLQGQYICKCQLNDRYLVSVAKKYNLTEDQLLKANPGMETLIDTKTNGKQLPKGLVLNIPQTPVAGNVAGKVGMDNASSWWSEVNGTAKNIGGAGQPGSNWSGQQKVNFARAFHELADPKQKGVDWLKDWAGELPGGNVGGILADLTSKGLESVYGTLKENEWAEDVEKVRSIVDDYKNSHKVNSNPQPMPFGELMSKLEADNHFMGGSTATQIDPQKRMLIAAYMYEKTFGSNRIHH